jgi:LytS/YehU family sensor histidine kinase
MDSRFLAMDSILDDVCVLVTAAFVLTLVPGFRRAERSLLSRRTALLVFLVLDLVEESIFWDDGPINGRIVAACAAGLIAGPWIGLTVGAFVAWLAVAQHGLPLGSIATSMLCGGLIGGLLYRWSPKLAQKPLTGFCLTLGVSVLRTGLIFFFAPHSPAALYRIEEIGMAPVLQGLGTALILAIVGQLRDHDEQTRAVALAEARALQVRMNPHFLFNALNALAALSKVAPRKVPLATGRLRQFLRASFDQEERLLVPVEEELAVVRAYLDIVSLRLGDRLKVEQTIDPRSLDALMPPFCFQPLVENAVQHGIQSSARAGRLQLIVRATGPWLEMGVGDDGRGMPSTEVEQLFFGERPRAHALVLLRQRLQGLFGRSFQLEVRSEIGEGTTITMRIPLRKRPRANLESPSGITSEVSELALSEDLFSCGSGSEPLSSKTSPWLPGTWRNCSTRPVVSR